MTANTDPILLPTANLAAAAFSLRPDELDWLSQSGRCACCGHLLVFHNTHCCSFCLVCSECQGVMDYTGHCERGDHAACYDKPEPGQPRDWSCWCDCHGPITKEDT